MTKSGITAFDKLTPREVPISPKAAGGTPAQHGPISSLPSTPSLSPCILGCGFIDYVSTLESGRAVCCPTSLSTRWVLGRIPARGEQALKARTGGGTRVTCQAGSRESAGFSCLLPTQGRAEDERKARTEYLNLLTRRSPFSEDCSSPRAAARPH